MPSFTGPDHVSSADTDLGKTREVTVFCTIYQDQWDRLRAVYPEMPEDQLVRECLLRHLYLRESVRDGDTLELTQGTRRVRALTPEQVRACTGPVAEERVE